MEAHKKEAEKHLEIRCKINRHVHVGLSLGTCPTGDDLWI